jgi:hypothetical protein
MHKVEKELYQMGFNNEEIAYLGGLDGELERRRAELEKEWGEGVIDYVRENKFWLELGLDVKKAESKAEVRMLGVIQDAAIGNHKLVEEKRKSVMVPNPDGSETPVQGVEITTVTKDLRPQWQAAAWFLERKWPEKYAQRKIVEGELPKDIPYEVFMTAKLLLKLPKTELDRVKSALRLHMQPRIEDQGAEVVPVEP